MTKLREDFIAYIQLLGHSPKTAKDYVNGVSQLAQHYNKSPLLLTPQEVRAFLLYIRNVRKLTVRTYNNYFYSIKKFYEHFLPNQNFLGDLRRMREPVHHPIVLSKEDVLTLIDSAANLKIKAAIALFYASGIRVEECSLLKMSCIDRKRMIIRIELGKGARDRITVLSHKALDILGEYWRKYRPEVYLFEGYKKGKPLSPRSLEIYVSETAKKAGINKQVTPHTLRHSFATHLTEAGVPLPIIQKLLGHADIKTTTLYVHLSAEDINRFGSPLDTPPAKRSAS